MKKNLTRGDRIVIFFFRTLFPKFYEEITRLNKDYRESQDAIREKQNELQTAQREIRQLKRGK